MFAIKFSKLSLWCSLMLSHCLYISRRIAISCLKYSKAVSGCLYFPSRESNNHSLYIMKHMMVVIESYLKCLSKSKIWWKVILIPYRVFTFCHNNPNSLPHFPPTCQLKQHEQRFVVGGHHARAADEWCSPLTVLRGMGVKKVHFCTVSCSLTFTIFSTSPKDGR